MTKYLRFTLEKNEYPYGKITPIWSEFREGLALESMTNKGVYPRKNLQREVLTKMLQDAFGHLDSLHLSDHFLHFDSPESIPSMEWCTMVSFMAVIWESCPETSTALLKLKEGLKNDMLLYITAHSALVNAGCRADSGGMRMVCTYIPDNLWQIFTTEALASSWMFEVNRTRAIVASGGTIGWAI